jgi:hypothetical protein
MVLLLTAPALAHCEPADDLPPPQAAENTMTAPPGTDVPAPAPAEPATPAAAAAPGAAASGSDAMYASGEYALGEDTAPRPPPTGAGATTPPAAAMADTASGADAYQDSDPSALTDFRATLDPYGTWVDDPTYGTVWVPSAAVVGPDFRPYVTAGRWVYDDDWIWVSDYDWGWAPFHYGRWVWIDGRGWAWIPGREYRGAWVVWGVDDAYAYVGWYPAPPAFVWFGGVAVVYGGWGEPYWVYCPRGEVFSPVVGQRVVYGAAAGPIASRVRVYTPATPGVSGPPPARLGFRAAQIPRPTGAAAARLARAQQFARPSTAMSLGAHPPSHLAELGAPPTRVPYPGGRQGGLPSYGHGPGMVPGRVAPPGGSGHKPSAEPEGVPHVRGGGWRAGGFHGGAVHGGGFGGGFHGGGGGRR